MVLGLELGPKDGSVLGSKDGNALGFALGALLGNKVGVKDGTVLGADEGPILGFVLETKQDSDQILISNVLPKTEKFVSISSSITPGCANVVMVPL
jgi:hypothetical protein